MWIIMFSHFFSIFPSSLFPNPGSDLRLWIMQPWPLPSPGCWGHFHPPTATNISSVVRNTVRRFGEIQLTTIQKYSRRRSEPGCWGHLHPPTATSISSVAVLLHFPLFSTIPLSASLSSCIRIRAISSAKDFTLFSRRWGHGAKGCKTSNQFDVRQHDKPK